MTLTGDVYVTKAGELVLEKAFDAFVKGEKFYILTYRGEGFYDLWFKGDILEIDPESRDKIWTNSKLVNYPEFVWWVEIKSKDGKHGWLRLKNISESGFETEEKIDGTDKCS